MKNPSDLDNDTEHWTVWCETCFGLQLYSTRLPSLGPRLGVYSMQAYDTGILCLKASIEDLFKYLFFKFFTTELYFLL